MSRRQLNFPVPAKQDTDGKPAAKTLVPPRPPTPKLADRSDSDDDTFTPPSTPQPPRRRRRRRLVQRRRSVADGGSDSDKAPFAFAVAPKRKRSSQAADEASSDYESPKPRVVSVSLSDLDDDSDEPAAAAPVAKRARPSTELVCRLTQLSAASVPISLTEDLTGYEIGLRAARAVNKDIDTINVVIQGKNALHAARALVPLKQWADVDAMRAEGLPKIFLTQRMGGPSPCRSVTGRYMALPEADRGMWDLTAIGRQNEGLKECPVCMEPQAIEFTPCGHPICSYCAYAVSKDDGTFDCPTCRAVVVDKL